MDAIPYAVLLKNPEQRDPASLARGLAAARKTPLQDQVALAKHGWGVLADNLKEAEAQDFRTKLLAAGIDSVVAPHDALVTLPDARPLAKPEGNATSLILIAAAGFKITSTTTRTVKEGPSAAQKMMSAGILLATGLPIKIGPKTRVIEKTQENSELVLYLDLYFKDPLRRRRIDAQNFDYSYLKERKLYQVLGNFKLFLGDCVKASPAAPQNHGTRVLMQNLPMNTMGYESLADLDRESRWLLTLQQLINPAA